MYKPEEWNPPLNCKCIFFSSSLPNHEKVEHREKLLGSQPDKTYHKIFNCKTIMPQKSNIYLTQNDETFTASCCDSPSLLIIMSTSFDTVFGDDTSSCWGLVCREIFSLGSHLWWHDHPSVNGSSSKQAFFVNDRVTKLNRGLLESWERGYYCCVTTTMSHLTMLI